MTVPGDTRRCRVFSCTEPACRGLRGELSSLHCWACQHENPPGAKFCVECANPMGRRCGACGAEVPSTAKFCPECAAPLTATSPPTASAAGHSSTPAAPPEAGERRHLTALFCDLV